MTHKTTALTLSWFAFYFYCCNNDYYLEKLRERFIWLQVTVHHQGKKPQNNKANVY